MLASLWHRYQVCTLEFPLKSRRSIARDPVTSRAELRLGKLGKNTQTG